MASRFNSISKETGDVGEYVMSKVLRSGHFEDHGVLLCHDKATRDRIVQLTPTVGKPNPDGICVSGIDGLKVKACPVTDKDGQPLEGGYKAVLKNKFRKETWEMARIGFLSVWYALT